MRILRCQIVPPEVILKNILKVNFVSWIRMKTTNTSDALINCAIVVFIDKTYLECGAFESIDIFVFQDRNWIVKHKFAAKRSVIADYIQTDYC